MDKVKSLLKDRSPLEPTQIVALKNYASEQYKTDVKVNISAKAYTIKVPNSSLAHKFRLDKDKITRECKLDKPLVIHIGY